MGYNVRENNPSWKGGKSITNGRPLTLLRGHPRARHEGYVLDHILIVEKALGRYLPNDAVVHHVNGVVNDNTNTNLVLCENNTYHKLLHKRQRALIACGNPSWVKCVYCHKYGDPLIMTLSEIKRGKYIHKKCNSAKQKQRRSKIKDKGGD